MSKDEMETYKLYRIRKTSLQLCRDRGYIFGLEEIDQTLEEFKLLFGENPQKGDLTILAAAEDHPAYKMYVFFLENYEVRMKYIRSYYQRLKSDGVYRAILVTQNQLPRIIQKALSAPFAPFIIEHFLESELIVNVTEHVTVPKHVLLTDEEKREVLQRYRLTEDQLLNIEVSDPVCRYYGAVCGQVIKIIRVSQISGRYATYRFVVE